jgi:hypothetical protein
MLAVQMKSYDVLVAIRDILATRGAANASAAEVPKQATGTDNRMPVPPLDMVRKKF